MKIDQPFVPSLGRWIPEDDTLCATKIEATHLDRWLKFLWDRPPAANGVSSPEHKIE
jgi:hypothetical protein